MPVRASLALLITLAACSNSTSNTITDAAPADDAARPAGDAARPDAGPLPHAATATVIAVTCPATVPLTVDAPDNKDLYVLTPASGQISIGGIVKFTMHAAHNVIPLTSAMTDPGLTVGFNETKCLQFTHAGRFAFACAVHGFTATVVVQ
jgi:plastocyanin